MGTYEEIDFLIKNGKSEKAFSLLQGIKETKTLTEDETGWMYWNISDIPAVMKNPHAVYENHVEFVEWGKQALLPHKLHWFVSDATQALTLSLGGYFDEWFDWYLFACKHSSRNEENRGIRFESHRAAAISMLILERYSEIDIPLRKMSALIEEDTAWENNIFVEFIYRILLAEKAFIFDQTELLNKTIKSIKYLTENVKEVIYTKVDVKESYMLGSWQDFNCSRITKDSLSVLLHNGACTFHKVGKHEESVEMFQWALQNGTNITAYGLSLYLSSLWRINKSNEEVIETFIDHSPKGLSVNELFQYAPDLKSVDWRTVFL